MSTTQDLVEGLRFRRDEYLRQEASLEARLDVTRQVVQELSILIDNFDLGEDGLEELQAEPPAAPVRRPAKKKPTAKTTKPKTRPKQPPMSPEVFDTLLRRARVVAKDSGKFTTMLIRDRLHVSEDQARKVIKTLLQNGEIDEAGRATGGRGTPPLLYVLKSANANGSE